MVHFKLKFPLRMGAAKTIHKAQGSTLKSAVVHFGSRKNEHMHYVGLSRVTHIENLHIIQLNENKMALSPYVLEEMNRLREAARIDLCVPNLMERTADCTVFAVFNTRSLHKHIDDIRKDFNLLSSDLIALSETHLLDSDRNETFALHGYRLYRFDSTQNSGHRSSHGLALYVKDSLNICYCSRETIENIQVFSLNVVLYSGKTVKLIFLYIPPKLNLTKKKNVLLNIIDKFVSLHADPVLVTGDFNVDNLLPNSENFVQFMKERFNLTYLPTNYTTDYGSALDHFYTNVIQSDIEGWGTLESYYSDHKPLYIILK